MCAWQDLAAISLIVDGEASMDRDAELAFCAPDAVVSQRTDEAHRGPLIRASEDAELAAGAAEADPVGRVRNHTMSLQDGPDLALQPGVHRPPMIEPTIDEAPSAAIGPVTFEGRVSGARRRFLGALTGNDEALAAVSEPWMVREVPLANLDLAT